MVIMQELADLDPSMSMSRTVEVLTKALDAIPYENGQSLQLSGDQGQLLDLVTDKIAEAEGYFDRPVDEPEIYRRLVAIGGVSGRDDLVDRFGKRTAQIEAAEMEFQARLHAFFGATSQAIVLFQKAVDLTPEFTEAVDGLGRAERRVEKSRKKCDSLSPLQPCRRTFRSRGLESKVLSKTRSPSSKMAYLMPSDISKRAIVANSSFLAQRETDGRRGRASRSRV